MVVCCVDTSPDEDVYRPVATSYGCTESGKASDSVEEDVVDYKLQEGW